MIICRRMVLTPLIWICHKAIWKRYALLNLCVRSSIRRICYSVDKYFYTIHTCLFTRDWSQLIGLSTWACIVWHLVIVCSKEWEDGLTKICTRSMDMTEKPTYVENDIKLRSIVLNISQTYMYALHNYDKKSK